MGPPHGKRFTLLQAKKILRNVVTELRWLPQTTYPGLFLQCSEDLQLRIWDVRCGAPAMRTGAVVGAGSASDDGAVPEGRTVFPPAAELPLQNSCRGGPNQIVSCCANGDHTMVLGTKGFSADTVELLSFDLRMQKVVQKLSQVAEHNIEALAAVGGGSGVAGAGGRGDAQGGEGRRFLAASKDGTLQMFGGDLGLVRSFKSDRPCQYTSCAVVDGYCFVAGHAGGSPLLMTFDLESGACVRGSPKDEESSLRI